MKSPVVIVFIMLCTAAAWGQVSISDALQNPSGIAIDEAGNIYIGERRANRILKVTQQGVVSVFAGTGNRSFSGDGGLASAADISIPETIIIDRQDNLIFCDRGNSRVRKINLKSGIIATVAGNGISGYSGDGSQASEASLSRPYGLAVDAFNNLYIADTDNHCIRMVDAKSGIISTVAGNGQQGFSGDGGKAIHAVFYRPHVIAIDAGGNLIIGDSFNQRIRKVDKNTGVIETIAGTGEQRSGGDGRPATKASFVYFGALVYDKQGNLLLTGGDHRIRKINAATNIVDTIAGTGEAGTGVTGVSALTYKFNGPYGMTIDKTGSLYVVDTGNSRVVKVDAVTNEVSFLAGKKD